jgi:hypothetical protein
MEIFTHLDRTLSRESHVRCFLLALLAVLLCAPVPCVAQEHEADEKYAGVPLVK